MSGQAPIQTYVAFFSSVLSLRGSTTVAQPYQAGHPQKTLCWNGEAWSISGRPTLGNDTEQVFAFLEKAVMSSIPGFSETRSAEVEAQAHVLAEHLAQIYGPYAFVFFTNSVLFYGRDFLGRRSLLTRPTGDGGLVISSVTDAAAEANWTEVEADGIYYIDLNDDAVTFKAEGGAVSWSRRAVHKVPYHSGNTEHGAELTQVIPRLVLNKAVSRSFPSLTSLASPVQRLDELLRQSLSLRILNIPDPPGRESIACGAKLAVLFSGGSDCTVLARLCHDILPHGESIDLLNVAFENPRVHKTGTLDRAGARNVYELCPDRITGRASLSELRRVCPERKWRFVAIDVPYSETLEHRQHVITLMHPHNTEMDLSISYALYFAARGVGYHSPSANVQKSYTTPARVLLSGLGADELFGGYQRHATAFNRNGFVGLLDELELDISRLGKRNLGRDDRIISHWGKEVRFPYLDEQLLAWALVAPVTEKCGFGEPAVEYEGSGCDGSELLEPGKKVLRCLAWQLGMRDVAKEKKRAIQFGARTAKMETGKTKGTQLLS